MQQQSVRRPLSKFLSVATVLTALIFAAAFPSEPAHAQIFTTLYTFPGGSLGFSPFDIIVAPNGTLYGDAFYGNCPGDLLFSISNGKESVLHRFTEPLGDQAEVPQGLVLDSTASILYGSTSYGGKYTGNCGPGIGCGLTFSYDLSSNRYKTLHSFSGSPADGSDPSGVEAMDSSGNLYGVTWGGGTNGNGTFYESTSSGAEKVLYSFGNSPRQQG